MMLHIKFDQDWPTGLRDIQVQKCEIFVTQGQVNSKMSGLIRPKIELDQAFMPVLVTATLMTIRSKMNELAWRDHFPIISLWEIF